MKDLAHDGDEKKRQKENNERERLVREAERGVGERRMGVGARETEGGWSMAMVCACLHIYNRHIVYTVGE